MSSPPEEMQKFTDWLSQIRSGQLVDELTMELSRVAQSVQDHQMKGTLTLQITIKPEGTGGRNVSVLPIVTAKPPQASPPRSIFFTGPGGSLHRYDPYEQRLDGFTDPELDSTAREIDTSN